MGNCIFKELGVMEEEMVKVVTPNGGVMELYAPICAESVTNEFPGYAVFGSPRRTSPPLLHTESLCGGQYYYLLPTHKMTSRSDGGGGSNCAESAMPYRMSVDNNGKLRRQSESEVFPRYNSTGVWKVRLVIDTDQLSEILSQEARTEALIESVRSAAKCAAAGVPSGANSDRRSWISAAVN